MKWRAVASLCTLAMPALCGSHVSAQEAEQSYVHVPATVSPEWQSFLRSLPDPNLAPQAPAPDDVAGWKRWQDAVEAERGPAADALVESYGVTVTRKEIGGVPVLDITPRGWQDNGKVLVYTHGGAYTLLSARTTLGSSALAAARTGLRVIAVDYTLAPHSKWRETTDEVVAVIAELRRQGYAMSDIAIYGDSAGGSLAAGVVLKMRDQGMGMPAAVVLWSPWADITETGDTYVTLRDAEPSYIYERLLGPSADAYADPAEQKHPYVSPVYGDFSTGFPPALIQGGTKEIFLSNFIRLYQALDTAGQTVKLDLYEGMTHVFQPRLPDSPESTTALKKMAAFLEQHLGG